jgi:hypothetical protein
VNRAQKRTRARARLVADLVSACAANERRRAYEDGYRRAYEDATRDAPFEAPPRVPDVVREVVAAVERMRLGSFRVHVRAEYDRETGGLRFDLRHYDGRDRPSLGHSLLISRYELAEHGAGIDCAEYAVRALASQVADMVRARALEKTP